MALELSPTENANKTTTKDYIKQASKKETEIDQ